MVVRNPSGNSNDILSSIIDIKYINQIMTIQNISAFSVTISGQTSIWNLIPNPISLPSGYQATLSMTYVDPGVTNPGSYYNIGVYNTNGGTGSGMTITVDTLLTLNTITVPGTMYVQGSVTTTNLTTPSATGLIIDISGVDLITGAVQDIQNIVNYVNGGYQDGDILQLNGGDGTARIQLTNVNSIDTYFINTLGDGNYLSTDVLNISGPGTGSGAQITLGAFITIMMIGKFPI
jgi:hypothetical protein